jgi:hypothetical protein
MSSHVILRFRFNHLKASIISDTFPKVMRLCFPNVPYDWNKSDWYVEFPNGSRIWFGGLDDKDRTEKILGQEHSTILFNECSQISYASVLKAITRLAQNVGLDPIAIYDENPPTTAHWSYYVFALKQDPYTKRSLLDVDDYVMLRMNPRDNMSNLSPRYIRLLESLPLKERERFLEGNFASSTPNALWTVDSIEAARVTPPARDFFSEIVVAIDPSGTSGKEDKRSDEVGIVVCGKGRDGIGYVLEDVTEHNNPEGWAKTALGVYDKWLADRIVAETNFGGDMVRAVIHAERKSVLVKKVTASRGKTQRAQPVSALFGLGKAKFAGEFPELESQLCEFTSSAFQGSRSPDRGDAMIWGMSDLCIEGIPYEGLVEFYEQMAKNEPEGPPPLEMGWDFAKPAPGVRIAMKSSTPPSMVQGMNGSNYMPDADGVIYVEPDDVAGCMRAGFRQM